MVAQAHPPPSAADASHFFGGAAPVGRDDQMNIELTDKEFRRLLDLVYIGNWILNSTREKGRDED